MSHWWLMIIQWSKPRVWFHHGDSLALLSRSLLSHFAICHSCGCHSFARAFVYLPPPSPRVSPWARGLCLAARFYVPSVSAARATRKEEAAKRRAFAHTRMAEKRAQRSIGTRARRRQDRGGDARKRQLTYEYSSRVGNVVRRISTNQGVNMTLAQKPTVREIN